MQTVEGDTGALVAAALVQAEMVARGASAASRSRAENVVRAQTDYRGMVARSYEYFLALVTTGEVPAPPPKA